MPHFKCLACKTRLRSTESQADLIGHLCPVCGSLLEPVGDLGEIVGYRVIETRGGTSHRGASRAGRLIAGRVGEIIVRRELKHAESGSKSSAATLTLLVDKPKPRALGLPGTGDEGRETPPHSHDSRAAASAARPRSFRCRASSARTAKQHESSRFAVGLGSGACHELGSTPRHDDDGICERVARAITIGVFLVGKPRTDMSPFERRGLNANATRCH